MLLLCPPAQDGLVRFIYLGGCGPDEGRATPVGCVTPREHGVPRAGLALREKLQALGLLLGAESLNLTLQDTPGLTPVYWEF